jgi:hypothetical protein
MSVLSIARWNCSTYPWRGGEWQPSSRQIGPTKIYQIRPIHVPALNVSFGLVKYYVLSLHPSAGYQGELSHDE